MQQLITLIAICLSLATLHAQNTALTCCNLSATQEFAHLTVDARFTAAHLNPQPTSITEDIGNTITYKTPDGASANAYEILTPYKTNSWLFVVHEWWGLNDHIKNEAIKYFKELRDVNILVLDLYDGQVATTREDAGKLMQGVKDERAQSIIEGTIKYVGKKANIATVGWCFGGGWSLQATILADKQATGAVMYYGMPETNQEKLNNLQADILFIHATQDDWINDDVVARFERQMEQSPAKVFVERYDAPHAFANPSNPGYHKAYTEDAFENTLKFLRKRFYQKGG